jgi:polyhydroxybutyrate depolymerase
MLAFAWALTGCAGARTAAPQKPPHSVPRARQVLRAEIALAGETRRYIQSAPLAQSGRAPVVVVLHGGGMSGEGMRAYADLESRSETSTIFVYPDAIVRNVWADEYALHWDSGRDLPFIDAMVSSLTGPGAGGDPKRVYVFGLSSGAYFANQLGCAWGSRLAGFVAVEGGGPFGECGGPVNGMVVHDPDDQVVPAAEGQGSLTRWLGAGACGAESRPFGDMCKVHACSAGTRVVSCNARGGIHAIGPGVREAALRFFGL